MSDLFESKKLREERGHLVNDMHAIAKRMADENRQVMTAEEKEHWDKLDSAQTEMESRIESLERVEKLSKIHLEIPNSQPINYGVVTKADRLNAFRAWALPEELRKEQHYSSAEKLNTNLRASALVGQLGMEARASEMTVADNAEGGYLTSADAVVGIDKALKAFGGVRQAARVIRTATGTPIHFATNDDTANAGAIVAENTTITNTDLTFGTAVLNSFKFTSGVYPVSVELIQDSSVNIIELVSEALGTRIARAENTYFTTGTGSGQPLGVVTGAALGDTADGTASIQYGSLVDLMHSVDAAYRSSPSCYWMFNDSTLAYLKKIVSSADDRPLWQPGLVQGEANTILGKPYIVNNDMASLGGGTRKVMLFGDFSKFVIRDVSDVYVSVLRERWAETGSVGFVAMARTDSVTLNTNAIKYMTT